MACRPKSRRQSHTKRSPPDRHPDLPAFALISTPAVSKWPPPQRDRRRICEFQWKCASILPAAGILIKKSKSPQPLKPSAKNWKKCWNIPRPPSRWCPALTPSNSVCGRRRVLTRTPRPARSDAGCPPRRADTSAVLKLPVRERDSSNSCAQFLKIRPAPPMQIALWPNRPSATATS